MFRNVGGMVMVEYPKTRSIQDTIYTGTWTSKKIPVYTVTSANGLNQLVGYVKHINAPNGTVLYRGQCDLHPSVIPSIRREADKVNEKAKRLEKVLSTMAMDDDVISFWNLRAPDIAGWKMFKEIAIEATLQHYGAETFCVDFVDNHWTALWFGLYRWDASKGNYKKRRTAKRPNEDRLIDFDIDIDEESELPACPPPSIISEIENEKMKLLKKQAHDSGKDIDELIRSALQKMDSAKRNVWVQKCNKIRAKNDVIKAKWDIYNSDNSKSHMYLFLYVAETNFPTLHGVSFGPKTYTVDLRKTLPSTFLRPCSQHGWVVKGKSIDYCYEENIACVIRIGVKLVKKMLGNGMLVSEENFFPSEEYDQGYRVLLQRQKGTHIHDTPKYSKILPENMVSYLKG